MGCPDIAQLERFASGSLEADRRSALDLHLSECETCRRQLREIQGHLRMADRVVAAERTGDDETQAAADVTVEADSGTRPLPAASFPGYRIRREISRGGQGVVYQAIQASTKRKVAIKVLKEGHFADSGERARFEREVQILGQLKHTNIVTIYDSGHVGGNAYFVMDYISGEPLDWHMAKGELSIDVALTLFGKICDAVHAAHLRGILHRDLKPSNIRIDAEGEPHILDFGLAKLAGSSQASQAMTLTGQFLGSLPWSSPEQAEGAPSKIDIRTDVYSLGVILYQMLTGGKFPYEVVGNMRDVLDRIMKAEPARPSTIRRQINDEVETIVLKCLSKDRERRYQSAGEVARDIRHYLAGEPIEAKRDSGWYVLRKNIARHWVPFATAAAFLLLLIGATVTSTAFYFQAEEQRVRAQSAAEKEADQRRIAEDNLTLANQRELDARRAAEAEKHERNKAASLKEFVTTALISSDPHQGGNPDFLVTEAMDQAIALLDSGQLKGQPETEAALRLSISRILQGNARLSEALRLAERALEINQQLHSDDHSDVAMSLNTVAACLRSLGRPREALPQYAAALEMRRRLFAGDHPAVAMSLNGVAACLKSLGHPSKALPKYEAAQEMLQRLFEGDNLAVATSLNNVASCLLSLRRPADALPKFEAALEMTKRLAGGDHAAVATYLNNLAACLDSLGHPDDALPKYEAALEMRLRLFQGDNELVASSLNNVARCLQTLDQSSEALPKFEAALEMTKRLFEGDHQSVATYLNNVAACLDALGRSDDALHKYEAALEMRQRLFEGDHNDVVTSINNVAACLHSLGRPAEALLKYKAALAMTKRLFGDRHYDVAIGLNNLAHCLESLDRWTEARAKFEEALEMFRKVLPSDHPHTLYPQIGLARTCVALRCYAEAEGLLLKAADQCERREAARRVHRQRALQATIELYDAWHAAEPDKGYDKKAADWRAKLAAPGPTSQPGSEPSGAPDP